MPKKFASIGITNFRAFDHFEVTGLGGVTLITGRNNVGKSTFLEAIRILATGGSPATFFEILNYREEMGSREEELFTAVTGDDFSGFCSLFSRYPTLAECHDYFVIQSIGPTGGSPQRLSARIEWYQEQFDPKLGIQRVYPILLRLTDGSPRIPVLVLEHLEREACFSPRPTNQVPSILLRKWWRQRPSVYFR